MVLSFLLFIPFLGGNIIVYTPNQGTKREKYFNQIFYKGKNADFGGKETPLRPFLLSLTAAFPSFDGRKYGSNLSEMDIKVVIPAPTQEITT